MRRKRNWILGIVCLIAVVTACFTLGHGEAQEVVQGAASPESPVITTEPDLTNPHPALGWPFYVTYAEATDPQGDPLYWRLVDAPSGSKLWYNPGYPNGIVVVWDTTWATPGRYKFRLSVDDGKGHYAEQKWHVEYSGFPG
jgi:hypothetical protein